MGDPRVRAAVVGEEGLQQLPPPRWERREGGGHGSAEVRELIDSLRPAALDRASNPRWPVPVALGTDGSDGELPAAVEVVTYRVVAEALTNVAKHAHARTAAVTVRRDARHLEVRVSDDGVGFGAPIPGRAPAWA